MIVVEGPDGSGKSTLIRMIKSIYPQLVETKSPGPLSTDSALKERLFWCRELVKVKDLICDRLYFFSEYVYGWAIRDAPLVDRDDIIGFLVQEFSTQPFNIIVYCKQEFHHKIHQGETLHLTSKQRYSVDQKVNQNIEEIRERYKNLFISLEMVFAERRIPFVEVSDIIHYEIVFKLIRELVIDHV